MVGGRDITPIMSKVEGQRSKVEGQRSILRETGNDTPPPLLNTKARNTQNLVISNMSDD